MRPDADVGHDGPDRRVGDRLRRVRAQQGRSLHEVELETGGEFKASVLGAYERGERSLSLARLERLASFYRVGVHELLPADPPPEPSPTSSAVVIDLAALERHRGELPVLARYVDGVRSRRGDHEGRVLTVRTDDLEVVAAAQGTTPEELHGRLREAELIR